ncbi:hypothetical protein [Sphingomonas morindae]|uniref:Anti-sigma factor NepR domain-containing protein n=1 Tax=Sphingomonas morindae TaxID=1541170 RepID=A0ABY4X440_9SPHN|nr:hypothetical protein [Sphingomonas morindae]USI71650.1 hypothetical protein LHA26_09915 [Sphingomonas morindae]
MTREDDRIVAVALLTEAEAKGLGGMFRTVFRVDREPALFHDLLAAIDAAEARAADPRRR